MDQTTEVATNVMNDPWAQADAAKPRDFEYYGQVKADAWFGFFPGGGAKPIPFDPQQHPTDKRAVMIDIQILPIPEQNVNFDVRQNYTDFSLDWTKVTLPSIKACGVDGLRALNGRFVRVALVDGKRERKGDNGNKTGEFYKTYKFIEVYADQAACTAAYAGAAPAHTEPESSPVDEEEREKATALQFARVVVTNQARGKTDKAEVLKAVTEVIAGMPLISKFYTGDSAEIVTMIEEEMK